jgi:hypothetical protein
MYEMKEEILQMHGVFQHLHPPKNLKSEYSGISLIIKNAA